MDLREFYSIQHTLLRKIPKANRFLYEKINWHQRLLGIIGARGTGKTTLLLQYLKNDSGKKDEHLYISADHVMVEALGLYAIGAYFFRHGGKILIIDEIHKYGNWAQELKNIYDAFPDAVLFFSGSSTMALKKGKYDLSRRAVYYQLPGLSFREYLNLSQRTDFQPINLSALVENHSDIAASILESGPILGKFKTYLTHGVYPFFLEGKQEYFLRLSNVIDKILYEDIPIGLGVKMTNVSVLKRILWLIATSQPFTPNIDKMSRDLKISKEYIYIYLDHLEKAGLLAAVYRKQKGLRLVRKPAKVFCKNTNILRVIAGEMGLTGDVGAIRENFFIHQLQSAGYYISIPDSGDFTVDNDLVFEIGGPNKKKKQIAEEEFGYLAIDDIEIGHLNEIPLWLFGFLY